MTATQQQGNPVSRFAKSVIGVFRTLNSELTAAGKPWRVPTASRSPSRRRTWRRRSRLTLPGRNWPGSDAPIRPIRPQTNAPPAFGGALSICRATASSVHREGSGIGCLYYGRVSSVLRRGCGDWPAVLRPRGLAGTALRVPLPPRPVGPASRLRSKFPYLRDLSLRGPAYGGPQPVNRSAAPRTERCVNMAATQHHSKPVTRWARTVRAIQRFNKVLAGI